MSTRARRLVLPTLLLLVGCADAPTAPPIGPERATMRADAAVDLVLNTQLRGIIDPSTEPSPAWGHVQLRLRAAGDAGYLAEWRGRLYNPDRETFSTVGIIDPDHDPGPIPGDGQGGFGGLVLSLFRAADVSCGIIDFRSTDTDPVFLTPEAAAALMVDPEGHVVVAVSDASLLTGRFGLPDPTTILGFNPQPDPPGKVSCQP